MKIVKNKYNRDYFRYDHQTTETKDRVSLFRLFRVGFIYKGTFSTKPHKYGRYNLLT